MIENFRKKFNEQSRSIHGDYVNFAFHPGQRVVRRSLAWGRKEKFGHAFEGPGEQFGHGIGLDEKAHVCCVGMKVKTTHNPRNRGWSPRVKCVIARTNRPGMVTMRYTKSTVILAFVGLVGITQTSCSNVAYKIAYQTADHLILGRIDGLFDLRADQKAFLQERIKFHLAWHRGTELPRYAQSLSALRTKSTDGMSRAEVDWLFDEFEGAWERVVERVLPDAAKFLATVDDAQVRNYELKSAKDNEELVSFLKLSPQKQLIERQKKFVSNTKDWTGSLTPKQEEKIRSLVPGIPDNTSERLAFRRARQAEFAALLRSRPGAPAIEKAMRHWYGSGDASLTPDYRAKTIVWRQKMKEFILALDKDLTPEQRSHAGRRAEELAGVARELYTEMAQKGCTGPGC